MPNITEIPDAAVLQTQLATLQNAIAALGAGATVPNLTVQAPAAEPPPGAPPGATGMPSMPLSVGLNPPIDNPDTLASLVTALHMQADGVTQQLVEMGYTAEETAPPETGGGEEPPEQPDWWPDDVPWPPAMPPALPGRAAPPGMMPVRAPMPRPGPVQR